VDLRRLRYFSAVAELLSFTAAARRLRVSQPSVTRQVALLEQELALQLLRRSKHHVELTEAGRVFYDQVGRLFTSMDAAVAMARRAAQGETGTLKIGYGGASVYLLALINTNLGQGGVAYYLHRKAGISFLGALSSILFIALLEIYQLFLFSTLGVIFYAPTSPEQMEIVGILRIAYIVAWILLAAIIIFFAIARRSLRIRNWVETGRARQMDVWDLL